MCMPEVSQSMKHDSAYPEPSSEVGWRSLQWWQGMLCKIPKGRAAWLLTKLQTQEEGLFVILTAVGILESLIKHSWMISCISGMDIMADWADRLTMMATVIQGCIAKILCFHNILIRKPWLCVYNNRQRLVWWIAATIQKPRCGQKDSKPVCHGS